MTDLPHFAVPFRFAPVSGQSGPGQAAIVNEQDSAEEIAACALVVLSCPRGFRSELPTFGITDPTFATPQLDLERIRRAIELWEPRARMTLDQSRDALDDLVTRAQVLIQVRTRE